MESEYLRYLEQELTAALRTKRKMAIDIKYLPDLERRIKWLAKEIYDLEMKEQWKR